MSVIIKDMEVHCRVTGYLLNEQIDFLNKALDALEREEQG